MKRGFLKLTAFGTGEQGGAVKGTLYYPDDVGYSSTGRMLVEAGMALLPSPPPPGKGQVEAEAEGAVVWVGPKAAKAARIAKNGLNWPKVAENRSVSNKYCTPSSVVIRSYWN